MNNPMNLAIGVAVLCCSSCCSSSLMNSGLGGSGGLLGGLLGLPGSAAAGLLGLDADAPGFEGGFATGVTDPVGGVGALADLAQGKPTEGNTITEVEEDSAAGQLFTGIEALPCRQCVNSDFTTYEGAGKMIPAGTCGQGSIPTTIEHCTQLFADQGKYIKQKEKGGKSVYYLSDTP